MEKKNWETYFNALKKQDWQTAKNSLEKILPTERNSPQIHLKLGDIHQRTGDSVSAIASYHKAAWLLRSQGFLQKAIALYKIILRLDPYNSDAISSSKDLMMELETARGAATPSPTQRAAQTDSVEDFAARLAEKSADAADAELFSGMPEDEVLQILKELPVKSFSGNERVIEEGDSGDAMYIIKYGRARVIAHLFGKEIELALLDAGDVFGEVGYLTGRPRTASVIAEGPLEVYEISRFEVEKLIESNPSLLQKIEEFYECRVQDTIRKVKS